MQIIVLFKPDPRVESACLCPKPFRNDSLQKLAIFHHRNSRKGQFIIILYKAYPLDFLLVVFKLDMKVILLFNGGIRAPLLVTI